MQNGSSKTTNNGKEKDEKAQESDQESQWEMKERYSCREGMTAIQQIKFKITKRNRNDISGTQTPDNFYC